MALISRMGGSILAQTKHQEFYMIGDRKEPIDFNAWGFADVPERDVTKIPYVKLEVVGENRGEAPYLVVDMEGQELAQRLAEIFLIVRNGSVSERLWGLVTEYSKPLPGDGKMIDANWLIETPAEIWDIVRDSILRCS